jgi:hypothetical protein
MLSGSCLPSRPESVTGKSSSAGFVAPCTLSRTDVTVHQWEVPIEEMLIVNDNGIEIISNFPVEQITVVD